MNIPTLSKKQLEVAKGLVLGRSIKFIARELNRSPRTVETHAKSIKLKFNCTSKEKLQDHLRKLEELKIFLLESINTH
ncbi:MAG: LuxR C-terminal-related transcriptional regulator [Alphaproteobacteria bacterium]|nr:LuxR C-terminal-related transcriptional regulator [Alphaproteobacteria bacterium]MCI5058647.1 LuxR C-terminal-related transcriptional regulator [Flavobacteriales bacterium]